MKFVLSHNQRLLLDIVRRYGAVSRAELSKLSGITAGAITRHSKELLLQGLLVSEETRVGQKGQPAVPLSLGENSAFSVGTSFNPGQIDVVVINFAGKLIGHKSCSFNEAPAEQAAVIIKSLADDIIKDNSLSYENCLGCGLAIPGYSAKNKKDIITVKTLSSWVGIDLIDIFEKVLNMPVWIENIAAAGTVAEYYNANADDSRNIAFLHLGYGIGVGMIINGLLYRGENGNSGEIGSYYPIDQARPSGRDLLNTVNNAGLQIENLSQLNNLSNDLQYVIDMWVQRASKQVSTLLERTTYWLDPGKIIVGGAIPTFILEPLVKNATTLCFKSIDDNFPKPDITLSKFGSNVTAIGAAFLPVHSYCSPSLDVRSVVRPNTFRNILESSK